MKQLNMIRSEEINIDALIKYLSSRLRGNKNWLCLTTGPTGSGKSYVNLRLGEIWYKYHFKEDFPADHVFFSIEDVMKKFVEGEMRPGEMVIIEEAGALINSREFQSKVNRLFNYYMQTFRCKNTFLLFNLPFASMLDKNTRMLAHTQLITSKIVKRDKVCIVKPYFLQVSQHTGKVYTKYLRSSGIQGDYYSMDSVSEMGFGIPTTRLVDDYEHRKNEFVDNQGREILDKLNGQDKNGKGMSYRMKQINTVYHKLGVKAVTKIAEIISEMDNTKVWHPNVSREMSKMDRMDMNWRDNPSIFGYVSKVPVLAPLST